MEGTEDENITNSEQCQGWHEMWSFHFCVIVGVCVGVCTCVCVYVWQGLAPG